MLDGAVILITGGARGMGLAVARLALEEGARRVVLADRDPVVDDAATSLGSSARAVRLDLTRPDAADELVARVVSDVGALDGAVNAAGVEGGVHPLDQCSDDEFERVMDVNVTALFRCQRAELRQMYAQGSGAIVNVASASVFGVHPGLGAYVASKAAVVTLSQVAAREAGPQGVRINALCPGLTKTPMLDESLGSRPMTSDIASRIPLGRLGLPQEQAEAAVWLCSDRSSFVTGQQLVVDGGRVG